MEIEERLQRLERHLNYQINENRKVSRRIDELEELLKPKQETTCKGCNGDGLVKNDLGHFVLENGMVVFCKICKGTGKT